MNPQYLLAYDQGRAILRNFQGRIYEASDPLDLPGGAMPVARIANPARDADTLAGNGWTREGGAASARDGQEHGVPPATRWVHARR